MAEAVDNRLIAKLEQIARHREALSKQLNTPTVAGDPRKSVALAKEMGRLRRLADPYLEFRKVRNELEDHKAIIRDSAEDPELRALAEAELDELQ